MRRALTLLLVLALLLGLASLTGCEDDVTPPEPFVPTLDAQLRAGIGNWGVVPIGGMPAQNPAQVALGQALFFDRILSGNRDVACATCHDVSAAMTDGRSLAIGTGGTGTAGARQLGSGRQFTPRSSPTLLNAGLGLYQLFWDVRLSGSQGHFNLDSSVALPAGLPNILTAQAMLPVLNRVEMRGKAGDTDVLGNPNELALVADGKAPEIWDAIMVRVLAVQEYVAMFNAAFPGIGRHRYEHAARAIAVFQMEQFSRTGSPFDRYLDRDNNALATEQKRGGLLFFGRALCSTCHNGPFLGAQGFANVGAPQIGPGGTRQPPLDLGRGEHDSSPFYRFAFRVAPLRNVELTAPYFHSGAYRTLDAVVRHYNDPREALRTYDPSQLDPDVRAQYHGDAATVNAVLQNLDGRFHRPLGLTEADFTDLVAFLKSLTDPAARNLQQAVPARVPSGLPVR
ncbi:MAG: cytochrome-c peroxidase [Gemmatimonadales bacterium]